MSGRWGDSKLPGSSRGVTVNAGVRGNEGVAVSLGYEDLRTTGWSGQPQLRKRVV